MAGFRSAQKAEPELNSNDPNTTRVENHAATTTSPSPSYSDSDVAVIGMACKFAGSDSLEQFWKILESGSSLHDELPQDRFPDWRFERRQYPKNFHANTINDLDAFDHKFFKIASREAKFMDPQQRLALQVTYQALESAAYFTRDESERNMDVGCYLATCMNEYHENVACHPPSAFSLTGSIRPFISGKISHHFGWTGPSMIFDTACAASGTAIHQACRAVASGECNSAVAGATNIFVSPDTFQNLAAGHFISPTGASKSFDAAADGYCRGEGVAFVVLKKLATAIRDGDPIQGVIVSTAVGQNANETNITIPHGPSQRNLYRKALRLAGLEAHDVSYVEAHGTGTPVGDPIEAESIRSVFGDSSSHGPRRKTYLGSLKSNIGHTEASSGISGLIKVLLMMQKGVIPQQALFKTLNPAIAPLGPDGIEIPTRNISWSSKRKIACVNNYGASGTNAVMIVTESPTMCPSPDNSSITKWPISIRAFSPSSLVLYCSSLLEFIEQSHDSEQSARNVAYNLSRRMNFNLPYSVNETVSSLSELRTTLKSMANRQPSLNGSNKRPVVLFFGGQTGKIASVPRALYDSSVIFRKHLDRCNAALLTLGAPSILPLIFLSEPQEDLVILHSMLFSQQYASAMAWLDCGLRPARIIGHSFGQLTALCVSGILSLPEGLRLVTERARLIEKHWGQDSGSMIAIEANFDEISKLLTQHINLKLEIACHNGPRSFVLAGSTSSVDAMETFLTASSKTHQWKRLQVTNAFHSSLAQSLIEPLQQVAERLDFQKPKLILETCSETRTWPAVTAALVASHTRDPVYFHQAVSRISEQLGPSIWLEAGAGFGAPMLRRALGEKAPSHEVKSLNLDSTHCMELLARLTAECWGMGLEVQFWPFYKSQQHQYSMMNLPPYQFDKTRHWLEWKGSATPAIEVPPMMPKQSAILQLGRKTKGKADFRLEDQCESWQNICFGHRVLGIPICPVSSMLNLVSEAIEAVQIESMLSREMYHLEDLLVRNPIPARPRNGLSLTIANINDTQLWKFKVSDAVASSEVYLSGTVSTSRQDSEQEFSRFQRLTDSIDLESFSKATEVDSIRGKAVYKSVADLFHVPEAWQTVKEVSSQGNAAIGHLIPMPRSTFDAVENLTQIPVLCLNSLRDRRDDEICFVTAIGQAKFKNSLNGLASMTAYVKFFESECLPTTCDIFVFDRQNKTLSGMILDVTLASVHKDSLRRAFGQSSRSLATTTSYSTDPPRIHEDTTSHTSQPQKVEPCSDVDISLQSANLPDLSKALYGLLNRVADVDPDAINCDSLIADLGIDSLMGMEVTEEINKFFSIKIDVAEAATAIDVGSLCRLIASQTAEFYYDSHTGSHNIPETLSRSEASSRSTTATRSDTEASSDEETTMSAACPIPHPSILRAFNKIRDQFDHFAKQAGCAEFWSEVHPAQAGLIVAYITEAFAKLGCDVSSVKVGERIPHVPHISKNDKLTDRLMAILCDDGLITQADNDWIRTSKPVMARPSSIERFQELLARFPQFASEHKLLHTIGSELDGCLCGKANPLALLFGSPEKRQLMAEQYLSAPIQSSVSQQLGAFIKHCFSSQPIKQTIRVLEIGGGTCGTTLHAVNAFTQLGVSVEYTFTDISSSFISAAKSKLAKYPFVKYRALDITEDPSPQSKGQYDMIIATNVLHATPDVCRSASNARQMLRPGGFLTLVEYTRNLYLLDVIFGQLDGWWLFEDGRKHAIMDVHAWKSTLQRAGFEYVDWTGGKTEESELLRIIMCY